MFRLDWDGESVDDRAENFQQLSNPVKRAIQKLGLEKILKFQRNKKILKSQKKSLKSNPASNINCRKTLLIVLRMNPYLVQKSNFRRQLKTLKIIKFGLVV